MPSTRTPMTHGELQQHITGSYFGLRALLVVVGWGLPLALVLGGLIFEPGEPIRSSLSDYYNSPLRDVFVGGLIAMAALLISYRGFSSAEDLAFDLAGLFAVVTALVPTGRPLHGPSAVALFVCLAYVCWFRAADTTHLLAPRKQQWYQRIYKSLAVLMLVMPAAAVAFTLLLLPASMVLVAEIAAVIVFGIFWFTKSTEFADSHAERKAADGKLEVVTVPAFEASGDAAEMGAVRQRFSAAFGNQMVTERSDDQ